ncbi:MAG: imidazole glycerol phosphate synthase subunit HisH [Verrucomicrobiota bacterium]
MKIGLIDYGRGNLRSVEKALERVGAQVQKISSQKEFQNADAVVLPGVGAFGDAMRNLQERELVAPILDWLKSGRPFLGICLGFQLLFESSEENPDIQGLSWLKGRVVRFPESVGKVPHIGWNEVSHQKNGLFGALPNPAFFYHVHSYYPREVEKKWIACETEYGGVRFVSGISSGNTHAMQFHPEKSQENGRKLLEAFVKSA